MPGYKGPPFKISYAELRASVIDLARTKGGIYSHLKAELDGTRASIPPNLYTRHTKDIEAQKVKPIPASLAVDHLVSKIALYSLQGKTDFPNELDTNIHPLLTREKWVISDDQWELIQPALHLATMFLVTPTCWEWYAHVATGVVTKDSGGQDYIAKPKESLAELEKRTAVERALSNLTKRTRFKIAEVTEHDGRDGRLPNGYADLDPDGRTIWVVLSSSLSDKIAKHKARSTAGLSHMIWVFYTANVLLHEIAHCFNHEVHGNLYHESRWNLEWPVREMGCEWERITFGFPVAIKRKPPTVAPDWSPSRTISIRAILIEDLMKIRNPGDVGDISAVRSDMERVAPSDWTPKWFLKSTWAKIEREGLGFMQDGMCEVDFRHNYPINGWISFVIRAPWAVEMPVVCTRRGAEYAYAPVFFQRSPADVSAGQDNQSEASEVESRYKTFVTAALHEVDDLEDPAA